MSLWNAHAQLPIYTRKDYTTAAGEQYRFKFDLDIGDFLNIHIEIMNKVGGATTTLVYDLVKSTGTLEYTFTATGTTTRLFIRRGGNGVNKTFYLDNVEFSKLSAADAGQLMAVSEGYRYAFNGKEQDPEWNGVGNSYDFGARIYDARLGRWLAGDLLESKYPSYSTYCFAINNPIFYIDADGNEKVTYYTIIRDGYVRTFTMIDDGYAVEAVAASQYESAGNVTFHNIERSVVIDLRTNISKEENQSFEGEYKAGNEISFFEYIDQKSYGLANLIENGGDYKSHVKGGFHFYTTDGFGQGQEMTEAEMAEFVDATDLFARIVNFKAGYYDSPSGLVTPTNKLMNEIEIIGFFEYAARTMKSVEFMTFDLVALSNQYAAWLEENQDSNDSKNETVSSGVATDTVIETTSNSHLMEVISRTDTTILDANGDTVSTTKPTR